MRFRTKQFEASLKSVQDFEDRRSKSPKTMAAFDYFEITCSEFPNSIIDFKVDFSEFKVDFSEI